jgi:lipoprotein-anchoring transpeptidase ErfK/SrfK
MPMKTLLAPPLAALLSLGIGLPAQASDRYRERPPVLVSPDLAAPWVVQLGGTPPRAAPRRGLFASPSRPVVRASAPSRARNAMAVVGEEAHPPINPVYLPQTVTYSGAEKAGTIVIDTRENFLYLVGANGQARRYGVGTGKPGFEWSGTHSVTRKQVWPDWRPPAEMITRERAKGRELPAWMPGGPANPLGARALYLGSTLYRIHGTNQPWTIGGAVSSGCIRMRNEDVVDLYDRVEVGAKVVVM